MNNMSGYDQRVAELYDHVLPYRNRQDVAFFVDAAKASGGPVLELGCGTGRVLIPTARAGIDSVGLDASGGMLSVGRERLLAVPPDVQARTRLVQGDMCAFNLGETFALITIPFRPFQHLLTVEDQLACLAAVHRHLRDTGRFILDVFNPSIDMLVNRPVGTVFAEEPEFVMPDGRRVIRRLRMAGLDRLQQINHAELLYDITHPDGRQEQMIHAFKLRYLFRFEVEHLVARAGFEVEQLYADYDKSPYGSKDPGELLYVLRKSRA